MANSLWICSVMMRMNSPWDQLETCPQLALASQLRQATTHTSRHYAPAPILEEPATKKFNVDTLWADLKSRALIVKGLNGELQHRLFKAGFCLLFRATDPLQQFQFLGLDIRKVATGKWWISKSSLLYDSKPVFMMSNCCTEVKWVEKERGVY